MKEYKSIPTTVKKDTALLPPKGKGFHIIYSKTLLDLMARPAIELRGKEISLEKENRKSS
jgi:hypothetical protein